MPSFRSPKDQAKYAVSCRIAFRQSRHSNKDDGKIHSLGTARAYQQTLKNFTEFIQLNRLGDLKNLTPDIAQAYLVERQESGLSQKTLDLDRQALQCHLKLPLSRVRALKETCLTTRSYSPEQVELISSFQNDSNSLATEIAYACGLRAHELQTILPVSERPPSEHRKWGLFRFQGRTGTRYTVAGKGGLIREIMIPNHLKERLESRRIEGGPINTTDRGILYYKNYDIGSGKNWSTSFSRVSKNQLGWSNGGHGLRHTYAQQRMSELQCLGFFYKEALAIVAQELGHFSPETTEAYLR